MKKITIIKCMDCDIKLKDKEIICDGCLMDRVAEGHNIYRLKLTKDQKQIVKDIDDKKILIL